MTELATEMGLLSAFGWLFFMGAAVTIGAAIMMVFSRSPLRAAMWLICALCGVALLFLLLDAAFVAAMQVLVYAGAIMVLFVFVIMLLNLGPDSSVRPAYLSVAKVLGTLAAGYFTFAIIGATPASTTAEIDGSVKAVGTLLLSDFLFAFEAISVLLLVAVIGAVVLGLKRLT